MFGHPALLYLLSCSRILGTDHELLDAFAPLTQVAAMVGSQVVATAGGPAKRALLRSMGVQRLAASRDTTFVEDLALSLANTRAARASGGDVACTGGADVVLNTLTSPGFVAGSLALLKPGGAFIEISKRDIVCRERVGMVSC